MNQAARDLFVTGLRNAHAMERQAEEMMERQTARMTDYPDLQARCREHLAETRQHLKRLEECLEKLGESSSTLKDVAMSLGGNIAAVTNAMAGDEILKNSFANAGFEHFEVAAYRSLIAINDHASFGLKPLLEANMRDDERMATWVDQHVSQLTLEFLRREERRAA
jgi:ferritin-like metal-binding protein YciE